MDCLLAFLQEMTKSLCGNVDTLLSLVKMGYKKDEALIAIERLGAFLGFILIFGVGR